MGNGCRKCCGKVQDWCRDSCGCCPCKCCKTTKIQVKTKTTAELKIEKKETPYGYGRIYPGVRTADNIHTSPVLEVHTWKKVRTQTTTHEETMTQTVALGGIQTERDNADRHVGPSRGTAHHTIELEEEVMIIPIESIISIRYSSEVKKSQTELKNVRLPTPPPPVNLSCCQKISKCCSTFWCCNNSKAQIHTKPEQIMTRISGQAAERTIVISIEHLQYSDIDTPSHVRVLGTTDQHNFYRDRLHTNILKFYLLDNRDFEQSDFDLKRTQATTLCRLVTQLKTMVGHYPDEPTLQMIIGKQDTMAIGDPPIETIVPLYGQGTVTNQLELEVPKSAIEN